MSSDQALSGKPVQRWMVRDYLIRGSVSSATSQAGPRLGLTVPDDANLGGLAPVVLGDPDDSSDTSISLSLSAGGSFGFAKWVHEDVAGTWHGYEHDGYRWGAHAPQDSNHQGSVVTYSTVFRRILVIGQDTGGTNRVRISYVDVNTRPQKASHWSSVAFTATNGIYGSNHSFAACELRDGTILLLVRRTDGDFDFYRSADGGLTWTLALVGMLSRQGMSGFLGAGIQAASTPRMARAGDWVCLGLVDTGGSITTFFSSDNGASWVQGTTLTAAIDIDDDLSLVQANDVQPYALVGVDDSTGAFAIFANPAASGDGNKLRMWYSSRGETFAAQTGPFTGESLDTTPRSYVAWCDPYFLQLWVYVGDSGTGDKGWFQYRVPRDRILDDASWQGDSDTQPGTKSQSDTHGATRLSPIQMTACWCDDRAALCGYLQDQEGTTPVPRQAARPWICWLGGWSARPWSIDKEYNEGAAEAIYWSAAQGEPVAGATSSATTEWTSTISGAGTHSWSAQVYVETTVTTGTGAKAGFKINQSATLSSTNHPPPKLDNVDDNIWASEFVCAVGTTGSSNGVRWTNPSVGGGGWGWQLTCLLATNQAIIQGNSGVALATLTGLSLGTAYTDDGLWHRFRLVVAPATSPTAPIGILQYRREDGDQWQETATFSIGAAVSAGITQHSLEFGIVDAPHSSSIMVSRWRRVSVGTNHFSTDYTSFTNLDLPGALAAPRPRGLGTGSTSTNQGRLRASWGGAGGARADLWSHALDYDYPASALTLESPQLKWRSAAGATAGARVVFDACGGNATADNGARFEHSALALYGLEHQTTVVTYSDDSAGTVNPVAATLSTTQYTGIRVVSRFGRQMRISKPSNGWRDGDLSGRMFVITAGTGLGQVHKIERHMVSDDGIDRLEFALGSQFTGSLIGVGDSVTIFADRGWLSYGGSITPKRYMTLQFGASGDNNWAGYWSCGSVVPGVEKTWSPPLLWTHTDEQNAFVTRNRARGGQSWAYRDAPPERTWTGRMMGAVQGERQAFRDSITYLARSGVEPCALLLNTEHTSDQDRSVLLATYAGSIDLDNQAYSRASGSSSQPWAVGDLAVSFTELT
jgi:hypothetical protein